MSYCKQTGMMCSYVDDECGLCGTSSERCIYIDDDNEDYRDIEEDSEEELD